jgi:oxygen-independent coproporphyrinogen III oxidase
MSKIPALCLCRMAFAAQNTVFISSSELIQTDPTIAARAAIMFSVPLGLYISVPFCPTKCSYCNFASGVFSKTLMARYVDRLCADLQNASLTAGEMGGQFDHRIDSIYVGGGTPSLLPPQELQRLWKTIQSAFDLLRGAELTVECAPGTLVPDVVDALAGCGVNRVSLGVQSMVDGEAATVGRRHTRGTVFDDLQRLRAAGIHNINVDLIAGLPHQTAATWSESLDATLSSGVPHVSVYMLEVDEDSRLGREVIAGGARYHAHFVPDDDATADFYLEATARLGQAGVPQYEISNFARPGFESAHNLKYWTRQPYLGFGVDAHSMLLAGDGRNASGGEPSFASREEFESVRFSTPDTLEAYLAGGSLTRAPVLWSAAREEAFFLGLRLNRGVDVQKLAAQFGDDAASRQIVGSLCHDGLLEACDHSVRLTDRGRLLSNEVFQRFLSPTAA